MQFFSDEMIRVFIRQFLYPSEEDLFNLVRFLVGKLSESSAPSDENKRTCDAKEELSDEGETMHSVETLDRLKDLRLRAPAHDHSQAEKDAEPNSGLLHVDLGAKNTNTGVRSKGDEHSCVSEEAESSRSIDQNSSQVHLCL